MVLVAGEWKRFNKVHRVTACHHLLRSPPSPARKLPPGCASAIA
jgi:hypothetical protein